MFVIVNTKAYFAIYFKVSILTKKILCHILWKAWRTVTFYDGQVGKEDRHIPLAHRQAETANIPFSIQMKYLFLKPTDVCL